MNTFTTIEEFRQACRGASRPLGLVPTMGALHKGHLSLVRRARKESDTLAASIFVNPTQFGPSEDFAAYPRNVDHDLDLLRREGVDLAFMPSADEMYPPGADTTVNVVRLASRLEGEFRPGHFRGVATVVAKLFTIARPDRAYFGQKDAQQVMVIRRMARDLNLEVDVTVCPTVRAPDGLALSSRNVYLDPEQRRAATVLYRALSRAQEAYGKGQRDADELRRLMVETLQQEPLARPQYVSVAEVGTLSEAVRIQGPALASMAVYVGKTRLIDNAVLGAEGL